MNAFKRVCRDLAIVIIGGIIAIVIVLQGIDWYQNHLYIYCNNHSDKKICEAIVQGDDDFIN